MRALNAQLAATLPSTVTFATNASRGTSTLSLGAQRSCILAVLATTRLSSVLSVWNAPSITILPVATQLQPFVQSGTTNNLKGATVCIYNPAALSQTRLEQVAENFKNGIAYVVTLLICGVFGGLGFAIFQLRSKDTPGRADSGPARGRRPCRQCLSCQNLSCSQFFSSPGDLASLGAVILVFRLLHAIPTLFILSFVFTRVQILGMKTVYKEMFARTLSAVHLSLCVFSIFVLLRLLADVCHAMVLQRLCKSRARVP